MQQQAKKERQAAARERSSSPEAQWPPKRKHHKAPPPPGPQQKWVPCVSACRRGLKFVVAIRLLHRREALLELGIISSAAEIYDFAQELCVYLLLVYVSTVWRTDFSDSLSKPPGEQAEILARLDEHVRKSTK